MGKERSPVLGSDGEPEARAYAVAPVPRTVPPPPIEAERVVVVDPRETETLTGPPLPGSGPRNPDQRCWPAPKPPGVELPDGLPIMKAQRIWIDPELMEQWEREEAERQARKADEKKRDE